MYNRHFPRGDYDPLPTGQQDGCKGKNLPTLDGVLKALRLDRFDKGDILLLLVLLFLYLESDDEDWFIILALVVFMGF